MVYKSGVKEIGSEAGLSYWFVFYKDEIMVSYDDGNNTDHIPYSKEIGGLRSTMSEIMYLGQIDGKDAYAVSLSSGVELQGYRYVGLRKIYGGIDDDLYWLANRAFHLLGWRKKNKFCGCCGSEMSESKDEVAMNCGNCGNIVYPRISPAIIVAITKGEQILLAHAARFVGNMYSVLAGFVEPGETLEECVKREVMEEVGISVKNVRYFASQPWPYPDSLMIGFTAEYESGEIHIDDKEITDANWYTRDNLPELPMRVSVARKLIDDWLSKSRK